jgi:ribosomal protein S18 acetylase RimI-like enzyme
VETLAQGQRTVLVAERGGRIVGIGTAGAPTVPALDGHGEILYLYVDPTQTRAGIGRALMRRLALALQAQGYRSVALGVVEGNQPAIDSTGSLADGLRVPTSILGRSGGHGTRSSSGTI